MIVLGPEKMIEEIIGTLEFKVKHALAVAPNVHEFCGNLASLCQWKRIQEMMTLHAKNGRIPDVAAGAVVGLDFLPGYLNELLVETQKPLMDEEREDD